MRKILRLSSLIFISLTSLLITILILEFLVRKYIPATPSRSRYSPYFIYENIPNYTWTNSHQEYKTIVSYNADGLRDKEYPYEKASAAFRIAVLGDSFAVGEQVNLEETFPKQLEKLLNTDAKKDFEVINFGVNGYNADNQLVFLKEKVGLYKPDLIILTFFFNDLDGLVNSPLISIKNGEVSYDYQERIRKETVLKKLGRFIVSNSKLWDYLINKKLAAKPKLAIDFYKIKAKLFGGETIGDVQNQRSINRWIGFRYYSPTTIRTFLKETPKDIENLWREEKIVLKEMSKISKSWDSKFIVVIATAPIQFRKALTEEALKFYGLSWEEFNPIKPNSSLIKLAKELNISILDLYKTIEENEIKGNLMHFEHDVHWNKQAHKVVAEKIYDFLLYYGHD